MGKKPPSGSSGGSSPNQMYISSRALLRDEAACGDLIRRSRSNARMHHDAGPDLVRPNSPTASMHNQTASAGLPPYGMMSRQF
jgi:hypothetical protein